jgi:phage gp36-like protein
MYLSDDDYKTMIQDEDLEIVQQSDESVRQKAELTAIEEVKGYLRSRYDVAQIFPDMPADPDTRNQVIVMIAMDITLYHLHASVPTRLVPELRVKRYDDAIKWLDKVQTGKVNPGLPLIGAADPGAPIRFGSQEKIDNSW